jgi:hypothetical protein
MEPNTQNEKGRRMTGGETEDRADFLAMRALLAKEPDVYAVTALSWVPSEGRWLYLLKTPFATWPKYVVGFTDRENKEPEVIFRCTLEAAGRECFNEQNFGDHL